MNMVVHILIGLAQSLDIVFSDMNTTPPPSFSCLDCFDIIELTNPQWLLAFPFVCVVYSVDRLPRTLQVHCLLSVLDTYYVLTEFFSSFLLFLFLFLTGRANTKSPPG